MSSGVLIGLGVGALVLFGLAAFLVSCAREAAARANLSAGTETSTCADVAELASSLAGEVGGTVFRHHCEIKGTAEPGPSPLVAPSSGQPCVWHRSKVTHRYWEMVTDSDSDDRTRRRQDRESVVSDETSQAPFAVDDGTGLLTVDPRGANVHKPEQSCDRFEPDAGGGGGGSSVSAFGVNVDLGPNSGSIGFQQEEWILRPNASLYLLGDVTDATGGLQMGKPEQDGELFISSQSEEQLVSGSRKSAREAKIGAGVAVVVGVGLLIAAAIGGLT